MNLIDFRVWRTRSSRARPTEKPGGLWNDSNSHLFGGKQKGSAGMLCSTQIHNRQKKPSGEAAGGSPFPLNNESVFRRL